MWTSFYRLDQISDLSTQTEALYENLTSFFPPHLCIPLHLPSFTTCYHGHASHSTQPLCLASAALVIQNVTVALKYPSHLCRLDLIRSGTECGTQEWHLLEQGPCHSHSKGRAESGTRQACEEGLTHPRNLADEESPQLPSERMQLPPQKKPTSFFFG